MPSVLDLTHTITETMPVYPGSLPPALRQTATVEQDGFAVTQVSFNTHLGTHIDAPAHMLEDGATLDKLGANHFVGMACVIDTTDKTIIERGFLESRAASLAGCEFLLFYTGWDRFWGQPKYFEEFPVLAPGATRWLAEQGLKGVGFDACSVDPVGSTQFTNHLVLFKAGMLSIENLTGLAPLVGKRFLFSCLPLKLEAADGCPVRAVAIL
jgi:kynurenine formamidase